MKKCPTCQTEKTKDHFKYGFKDCKKCINDRNVERAHKIRNGELTVTQGPTPRIYDDNGFITHKRCSMCRDVLSIDLFNNHNGTKDGYNTCCRQCQKDRWHEKIAERRIPNMIARCKTLAKKNNFPFDLTVDDITIPERCPVLGIPLEFGKSTNKKWRDNSPSIDKIIPELGYVKGNIIIVSYRANRIKNDATIDELQLVAEFYKTQFNC